MSVDSPASISCHAGFCHAGLPVPSAESRPRLPPFTSMAGAVLSAVRSGTWAIITIIGMTRTLLS